MKNNPQVILKVPVGLNVDKGIYGLIEHGSNNRGLSDDERLYEFFTSIKNSINTEQFDNREFYEQVRFFEERLLYSLQPLPLITDLLTHSLFLSSS